MDENVHKHYEWKPKNRNNSNDHQVIHWKDRCWSVAAEALLLWPPNGKSWHTGKDSDAGKEWRKEEKGTTGWDGWMASRTQWTWVCINSGSWWWTERPGMLQSMGSQRVGQDWVTELNWTEPTIYSTHICWVPTLLKKPYDKEVMKTWPLLTNRSWSRSVES